MKERDIITSVLIAIIITGCSIDGVKKSDVGAVLGGTLGAVLGREIGDGTGRIFATAAGGIIGAYIGNSLGKHLDERDRLILQGQTAEILNKGPDAGQSEWENNQTGSNGEISVSKTRTENRPVKVVKSKNVDLTPKITLIGEPYQTTSSVNVRQGPSSETQVLGGLSSGDQVRAVGVTDNNWILIAKNNVTVGYVSGDYLASAKEFASDTTAQEQAVMRDQEIDLDDIELDDSTQDAFDLDSVDLEEGTILADTECRELDIETETTNGNSIESFTACKGMDGAWVLN